MQQPSFDLALFEKLCEEASREQDPKKLLELTGRIKDLLDGKSQQSGPSDDKKIA
jgi:hypothetical protein